MKIARNVLEPDKQSDGGGGCFALKKLNTFKIILHYLQQIFIKNEDFKV